MSTNATGDGLGGNATQDPIEEQFEPQVDETEPLVGGDPGGPIGGSVSDETAKWMAEKGWSTVDEAIAGYKELETKLGTQGSELGDAKKQAEQASSQAAAMQQLLERFAANGGAPQGEAQQELPQFESPAQAAAAIDWERIDQLADGDPDRKIEIVMTQVVPGLLEVQHQQTQREMEGRIAPVAQHTARASIRDQAQVLATRYGQEFVGVADEVQAEYNSDPIYRQAGDRGLGMAYLAVKERHDLAELRKRESEGESLLGSVPADAPGGGGAPTVDIAAEIRSAVRGADGFGAAKPGQDGLS